jgi:ABC-2 type transport system permease protein
MAHRSNFAIGTLHALLNAGSGVLGIWILFAQVEQVRGWDFNGTLALLGVYLTLGGLRQLVFGPSLDALAGMDGEVWSGRLDFTLIRPVNVQFLASVRHWRPLALFDLSLGTAVVLAAIVRLQATLTSFDLLAFFLTLSAATLILYALLLALTALVFWAPGVLYTWIFDALFQMGRYPLGLYPGWVRLLLTWIVPVGLMTTLPAAALTGMRSARQLPAVLLLSVLLVSAASLLFQRGLRRYESASS